MRRYKFAVNHVKKLKYLSNNLWLTDKFVVDCWSDTFYEILMPKIFRCEIKELTIKNSPNLPFKYFKFLTESGTVKNLKLYKTEIFCSNDETDLMAFDEILECIPNANTVSIDPCRILSKNMSEFEIINRKIKFEKIELFQIVSSRLGLLDFLLENVENWDKNYKNIKIEFQDPDENNWFKSDFSFKVCVLRIKDIHEELKRMISKLDGMEVFIERPKWCQKSKYACWFM
uniref:FTH domain-containing protein n=1 Tax=Panagrolaimus davidi TaxID=227884 RepID=A0A914PUT8_9BILA